MAGNRDESGRVGVVVIGRNEGERLVVALRSIQATGCTVVYVDSDSNDGSVERARDMGVPVVELDLSTPFSAARARNAGFRVVLEREPSLQYVQFMDGDCELDPNWISVGTMFLKKNPKAAIACGRRRERFPERSVYNMLCDMEWDTPVGQVQECGGDCLVRVSAFQQVSGFREQMIAGEEPELCVRLRAAGWAIWRLGADMTRHDANILHFRQWWRRSVRCGYAYAAISVLHGGGPDRSKMRQLGSAVAWGGAIPLGIVGVALIHPPMILLSAIYFLQALRIGVRRADEGRNGFVFGALIMAGKFSELVGIMKYWANRMRGKADLLIEYK